MAIYTEIFLEKRLATSDEISICTNEMQLNCAEYELLTWLAPPLGSSDSAFNIQPICEE